jgi:hypothetical protein
LILSTRERSGTQQKSETQKQRHRRGATSPMLRPDIVDVCNEREGERGVGVTL